MPSNSPDTLERFDYEYRIFIDCNDARSYMARPVVAALESSGFSAVWYALLDLWADRTEQVVICWIRGRIEQSTEVIRTLYK